MSRALTFIVILSLSSTAWALSPRCEKQVAGLASAKALASLARENVDFTTARITIAQPSFIVQAGGEAWRVPVEVETGSGKLYQQTVNLSFDSNCRVLGSR